jgi:hypothetical protein
VRTPKLAEYFDLASLSWTTMPDLPGEVDFGVFVRDGPEVFLVTPAMDNPMYFDREEDRSGLPDDLDQRLL